MHANTASSSTSSPPTSSNYTHLSLKNNLSTIGFVFFNSSFLFFFSLYPSTIYSCLASIKGDSISVHLQTLQLVQIRRFCRSHRNCWSRICSLNNLNNLNDQDCADVLVLKVIRKDLFTFH